MSLVNQQIMRSFLYFFGLLIILNPFLLIDPELLIFFSISFIILLFINNLSDVIFKALYIKLIQYYYFYIRFYNLQLIFLFEYTKYLNLNMYLFNLPFFVKWFHTYFYNFSYMYDIKFFQWNQLFSFNFFKILKKLKQTLLIFYINFFLLFRRAVRALFIKKKISNYRLLSNYILKHLKYIKNPNKRRNYFLIRRDLPNLVKFLKIK